MVDVDELKSKFLDLEFDTKGFRCRQGGCCGPGGRRDNAGIHRSTASGFSSDAGISGQFRVRPPAPD